MRYLAILAALLLASGAQAATCSIVEYGQLKLDASNRIAQIAGAVITTQVVTYTVSAQSTAFNSQTRYIRIICTAKAHYTMSTNPTATANHPWVPADSAEYIGVVPADEIAFYDGTS